MIALEDAGVLLITPPKAASTALHLHFCKPGGAGVEIVGPLPGRVLDIEPHTFTIPRRWHHLKTIAVVVRNPYARARSLYRHAQQFENYNAPFRSFAHQRLIRHRAIWWFWQCATFGKFATERLGFDLSVVRVEHLQADLRTLGVDADGIEPANVNGSASDEPPAEWIDRSMVNTWAGDDFTLGGYEMAEAATGSWAQDLQTPTFPPWKYENHNHRKQD